MIAVVEAKHRCVWGLGRTPDEAWADARESIASKIPEIRPRESDLSLANMAPEAEHQWDGLVLWQWVILDSPQRDTHPQAELF